MMSFTVVTASLLCSLGWISVSGSESHTVEAQPGEDVTLLCSNFSNAPSQIYWFRVVKGSQPRCVSFMFKPPEPAILCDGFQNGKFEMRSNMSAVFLKIKQVNSSDSGLYFCGFNIIKNPVIVGATYLDVQEEPAEIEHLMSVILAAVTVVLTKLIIGLVVTNTRFQTACFPCTPGACSFSKLCGVYGRTVSPRPRIPDGVPRAVVVWYEYTNRYSPTCSPLLKNTVKAANVDIIVNMHMSGLKSNLMIFIIAESDGTAKLMSGILGALTVLLVMIIIGLVVKNRKLQTAANEEQNPQQPENRASEEVNYAAVAFRPKTRRKREVEPNVVYASTR
ncbi:uncharacterized protein LOC117935231 [Etheostoma cragini]|uniref:uncharacterized protein LOC117935231 n=1 Tax=Etheostoma cragini TaxID=417921 RepID=UPI00155E6F07|nr:uncharacterized protein LOC117935231 [Etheostoma cragini]